MNMKKLVSLVLALVMVMAMMVPAMAEEAKTYTITINGKEGHTYEVYQIFTGDLSGNVLSNIVWGDGVNDDGQTKFGSAADKAASLTNDNVKAFAADVQQYLTNGKTMAANNGTYTLNGLEAGYYLIKDQNGSQEGVSGTYTAFMLKIVKDVTATPKDSVPSVDKEITGVGEVGDYNIGDKIPYTLTATLGSNLNQYEAYYVVFHDTLSAGLTYNNDAVVKVDGTDVTESDDVDVSYANGKLTVTIADALALNAHDSSEITVEYTATLNAGAVVGGAGNPNTVKLEYSNDPNVDYEGDPTNPPPTGETPEDTVVVFTFELDVTKVDGADKTHKLKGAEFKLKNEDGKWVIVNAEGKVTDWADTQDNGSVLTSDENGFFKISGLEDGTYYLKETKAPDGYNLLPKEITIVITSTYDETGVKTLTIKVDIGEAVSGNTSTGIVDTTVENNAGATLPETGGMGTTMMYIGGGLLVAFAVIMLATKRRMNAAE